MTNSPASTRDAYVADLPARALDGVRTRRMFAVGFDLIFISLIVGILFIVLSVLGIVTFGLTWLLIPPLFPAVALFYNGLTISGWRHGTPGMRLMDLEMRLMDGGPTPFLNAAAHAVLFYISWTVLSPVVLVVSLLSRNKRCLHDMLAGVVVTRRQF